MVLASCLLFQLLLLLVNCAQGFLFDQHQHGPSKDKQHWSYGNQEEWRQGHRECGLRAQSPINIQRRDVIHNHQLKLHFYNYNQPLKFLIQNNHHTIKMQPMSRSDQQLQIGLFGLKLLPEHQTPTASEPAMPAANHSTDSATLNNAEEAEPEVVPASASVFGRPSKPTLTTGGRLKGPPPSAGQIGRPIDGNHIEKEDGPSPNNLGGGNEPSPLPYNGEPSIKLDWLDDGNNEYQLKDIHFHWGERKDNGSEHAIDGSRSAMEMHLVHVKHGLEKSQIGITSDSITVIALLIESLRRSNVDFNPIVDALARVNGTNQGHEIEYKSLSDLLPVDPSGLTSFYTYSGSLTTPPCYQVVNWVVMTDRIYLNAKQIEMFRNLYTPPSGGAHSKDHRESNGESDEHQQQHLIMPNIRQLQPLNSRTIMASFTPSGKYEIVEVPYFALNGPAQSGGSSLHLNHAHQLLFSLIVMATVVLDGNILRDINRKVIESCNLLTLVARRWW